jgi:hypothetical protein
MGMYRNVLFFDENGKLFDDYVGNPSWNLSMPMSVTPTPPLGAVKEELPPEERPMKKVARLSDLWIRWYRGECASGIHDIIYPDLTGFFFSRENALSSAPQITFAITRADQREAVEGEGMEPLAVNNKEEVPF